LDTEQPPFILNPQSAEPLRKLPMFFRFAGLENGCMTLFMLPFILAGICVTVFTVSEWWAVAQLNAGSAVVAGRVTDKKTTTNTSRNGTTTTYTVYYSFNVDDRMHTNNQSVSAELYNRLEVGGRVDIRYATSDVGISRVVGADGNSNALFLTVFAVLWNGFVILFLVKPRLKNASTLQDINQALISAVTLPGEVVRSSGFEDAKNNFEVTISYEFKNPQGEVMRGQSSRVRNDLKRKGLPEVGTPVAVAYQDDLNYNML
jgi:hypothetical protein